MLLLGGRSTGTLRVDVFIGKGNADGDARGTVWSHRLFIRKEI